MIEGAESLNTINHQDLIGIYRTLHPTNAEYALFWSAHGTFTKTDHMLNYKTSLSKFRDTEILLYVLWLQWN